MNFRGMVCSGVVEWLLLGSPMAEMRKPRRKVALYFSAAAALLGPARFPIAPVQPAAARGFGAGHQAVDAWPCRAENLAVVEWATRTN